ncbi:beta-carotene 15,15'-monooxygenase [Alloscardovia macacae]|uniref:Beta-carotene 15,15'-monooxygenase n=1 Tax=Alloscardovia macacae TaxID=1160091 RepID=A0A1Y2SVY1_9BIFI|nr:YesL family protein [Alloscardovia macacae]OTA26392.1 beta-carotene 15,15'-monooxygenase [Alloscardovia macacae]OTA28802.1 beta-carotene 15,15'-monooxygenase [Alloscardovia macacae]
MNWLSPDSRFMQAWNNLTDGVLLNLYMLLTSLPLVTVGAALAAGNVAARKTLYGEGRGVTRAYFSAFRQNFRKATLLWLPYLAVGLLLGYMWLFVQIREALILQYGLSIVWVVGMEWTFAVQARFENTVPRTWFNSLVFGVVHIPYTLALVLIDAVYVGLFYGTVLYMPQFLFLVVVLGYGSMLMLHVPFTERVFMRYGVGASAEHLA